LLSIATWLSQHGFSVKIFDSRLHLLGGALGLERDLQVEIKETRLFVGVSVYTMHIAQALQISQLVKAVNPVLPVVWGGVHPTLYPEQTVADPLVDLVVVGEGEEPLLRLAQVLGKSCDLSQVPSLVYKRNGVVKQNRLAEPFDVNLLAVPCYDLLELPHYLVKESYNPQEEVRGLDYNGSRGCSYDCAFCINRVLPQQHCWRARAPNKIAEDLAVLKEKYGVKYVFFEEEFPLLNPKRNVELAQVLKPLDLRWYGNIRADHLQGISESLKLLRGSGWCETSVGAESGSDRMLAFLHKGITVEQTVAAAKILNELDVYCLYSFMTDLPTETTEEKMATFSLMRRLRKIHMKSEFIGPQSYRLYPKTAWYEKEIVEGRFKELAGLREWVSSGLSDYYAR
jgi:radical SAM superfamily enzyme YgiQ (UPF0313 family)